MPPKATTIKTHAIIVSNIHAKERQLLSDLSGAQNTFVPWWQTRLINWTVIAAHESTSKKQPKKETMGFTLHLQVSVTIHKLVHQVNNYPSITTEGRMGQLNGTITFIVDDNGYNDSAVI